MNDVHPAAMNKVCISCIPSKDVFDLTDILEYSRLLVEDDMEIPAPAQRPHRRLNAVTLPADDLDFDRAVWAFRVGAWNPTQNNPVRYAGISIYDAALRTLGDLVLDTTALSFCTASAGRSRAEGLEALVSLLRALAFRRV